MNQPLIHNEEQMNEYPTKELSVSMSQINLREWEIKELKEENHKLRQELAQNIEERNTVLNERKKPKKKSNELKKKIRGKVSLHGARHLIWDGLSVEDTKFKPYLNYVNDKSLMVYMAFQICKVVNETMYKKSLDTTHSVIDLLNTLTYEDMQEMEIRD